jgi:hypothetical protein
MNHTKTFKKTSATTPDFVEKRNKRLERFFRENGYDHHDIRIIGEENNPAVLYQDTYILPCYVHNFEFRWTDKQYDGQVIKTYKLTAEVPEVRAELDELIRNGDMKKVHKISATNSNLFLIGWNYLDKENKSIKFPVFGRYSPKVYHTVQKAEEIVEALQMQGYACRII